MNRVAIIGSSGLPAQYGGFETLASNLVMVKGQKYSVYCSSSLFSRNQKYLNGTRLHYVPLPANGTTTKSFLRLQVLISILVSFSGFIVSWS